LFRTVFHNMQWFIIDFNFNIYVRYSDLLNLHSIPTVQQSGYLLSHFITLHLIQYKIYYVFIFYFLITMYLCIQTVSPIIDRNDVLNWFFYYLIVKYVWYYVLFNHIKMLNLIFLCFIYIYIYKSIHLFIYDIYFYLWPSNII